MSTAYLIGIRFWLAGFDAQIRVISAFSLIGLVEELALTLILSDFTVVIGAVAS